MSQFAKLLERIKDNTLSGKLAKQAFIALFAGEGGDDETAVDKKLPIRFKTRNRYRARLKRLSNVLKNNRDGRWYKSGKEKAFNGLVGQVMKASKGKANPAQVNQLLKELIG